MRRTRLRAGTYELSKNRKGHRCYQTANAVISMLTACGLPGQEQNCGNASANLRAVLLNDVAVWSLAVASANRSMSVMAMLRQLPFVPNLHFLVMLVTIAMVAHLRELEAAKVE